MIILTPPIPEAPTPARRALVLLYLLGVYLYVPLYLPGGIEIPGFMAWIAGWLLLAINVRQIYWRPALPLIGFLVLVLVGLLTAPQPARLLWDRADSYLFMVVAVSSAYGLVLELIRWPSPAIARTFGTWTLVIIAGCLLEMYGGLKPVSDAFRHAVFPRFIEGTENVARDLVLFGSPRPRVFTAEPAWLAEFALLAATTWLMLTVSPGRYVRYALVIVLLLLLIRSPVPILGAPLGVGVLVYLDGGGIVKFMWSHGVRRKIVLGIFLLGVITAGSVAAQTVFSQRLLDVARGTDVSVLKRVMAPLYVTREVIATYPITGIGVGGEDAAVELYERAYRDIGESFYVMQGRQTRKLFNFFWTHWVYLGLGYGMVALFLLAIFMKRAGLRQRLLLALMVLVFAQTMGGYIGIRVWSYIAILFVGVWHGERMGAGEPRPLATLPAGAEIPVVQTG